MTDSASRVARRDPAAPTMLSLLVTALAGAADFAPLELNNFVEAHLTGSSAFYRVWLSSSQSDVKVHLLPLSGDADLLVSFDPNATFGSGGSHTVASWSLQSQGVEELLLRRHVFCKRHHSRLEKNTPTECFHEFGRLRDGSEKEFFV